MAKCFARVVALVLWLGILQEQSVSFILQAASKVRLERVRLKAMGYESLTVKDLKEQLKSRGLSVTGRKAVLIQRLEEDDEEEPDVDSGDEDPCGPYLDDQGLLPNGSYMCLDGVARTGNWEEAKRRDPTDLTWLTEWVVAARTGQLEL